MEKIAEPIQVGRFEIAMNSSGEMFLSLGKTRLRISGSLFNSETPEIQITFSGNGGEFIPDKVGGLPAMVFRGKPFLKG